MKTYLFIGFLFLVLSCRPIASTRNNFANTHYCYDGKDTGIEAQLNTNGYYTFSRTLTMDLGFPSVPKVVEDTIDFFFTQDGIFIYNYNVKSQDGFWGRYVVSSDTIKGQFLGPPGGMSWSKGEFWFKIIDRNHLQYLCFKWRENITVQDVQAYQNSDKKKEITLGQFIQSDIRPNLDNNWLKKREWFWCDKVKYKAWKKAIK